MPLAVLPQAVLILLILVPPISLKGLVGFLGSLSIAGGVVVLGSALLSLGRNLSPLPQPRGNHELVTSGMYGAWQPLVDEYNKLLL